MENSWHGCVICNEHNLIYAPGGHVYVQSQAILAQSQRLPPREWITGPVRVEIDWYLARLFCNSRSLQPFF